MLNKVLSSLALMTVIGLAGYEYGQDLKINQRMDAFMSKGPRFTAADGQALCERVRALEQASYGYRDAGKTPLSCEYLEHK